MLRRCVYATLVAVVERCGPPRTTRPRIRRRGQGAHGDLVRSGCAGAVRSRVGPAPQLLVRAGAHAVSGDPASGSRLRHGLLGRGDDLQPPVLGCAIARRSRGGMGVTCRRVSKPGRRTIASACTSAPWPRSTKMAARERSRHVTRPTASRWPPRTRSIPTTRRSCSMVSRSSATSARARRDSRCRAARSISSNRSTRPTSSILGVLHYLIHAYDDPVHAEAGLPAARVYAKTAAAVPHAYHMPSHIFTRLGYWDEAATTNENAWQISNDDVKAAGEPGELRDFHSLNYLSYNYLQLGRYKDAKKAVDLFAAQYDGHHQPQDGARLARPAGAPRARPDDLRPARSRALRLLRHPRPLHRRIGIVERCAQRCRSSRRRAISW